jgi:hypothetical protein
MTKCICSNGYYIQITSYGVEYIKCNNTECEKRKGEAE